MLSLSSGELRSENWRSIGELVQVLSDIQATIATYNRLEIESPEWLLDKEQEFIIAIELLQQRTLREELKKVQKELDKLKPTDEKKTDLQNLVSKLTSKIK